MAIALPALLCLASGFLLISLGWPRRSPNVPDHLFQLSLSVGYGLGIYSIVFFLLRLLGGTQLVLVDLGVFAFLLVTFYLFRNRRTIVNVPPVAETMRDRPAWLPRVLTASFAVALCAALYSAVMRTLAYPHGDGWDAFSIWNLHARFLFRGGPHWRDGFTPLLPWSHPDYPLLLPAAIAHFWSYLGNDAPAVPAIIGLLFTFGTVGLMFSALSILRGRNPALLGTTALLATPSFIELGTSQYADVPLSFFILAAISLLCLHGDQRHNGFSHGSPGMLVLAGVAASCAAWTKNEGLLFLCAIVLSYLFVLLHDKATTRSWISRARPLAPLLAATVPAVLLIAGFKHFIAPPGDLLSDPAATLQKLLDPARYWAILRWYIKGFFLFGRWLLLPGTLLLLGLYFAGGKAGSDKSNAAIRTSLLTLALTLAGYFAVYLITPYDIYWHLRFSLTRLFLQLWPAAIFLFFLLLRYSPKASLQPGSVSK